MEKEFNLNEERKKLIDLTIRTVKQEDAKFQMIALDILNQLFGMIEKQDKEFIKRLKEHLGDIEASYIVDKLAGDKLI